MQRVERNGVSKDYVLNVTGINRVPLSVLMTYNLAVQTKNDSAIMASIVSILSNYVWNGEDFIEAEKAQEWILSKTTGDFTKLCDEFVRQFDESSKVANMINGLLE